MKHAILSSRTHSGTRGRNARGLCAAVLATAVLAGGLSVPPAPAMANQGIFPQCHDASVEHRIMDKFNWAEKNTWRRGFDMTGISQAHEHRTTVWRNSSVTRRYCMGTAHMTDHSHRSVYFLIEDRGGFVGRTWNVTFCVSGLDPWRNHDGNCRTVR